MILKHMNIVLTLMACVMVSVIGMIYHYSLDRLAYTLLVVFLVFYILSTVLQRIIMKNVKEAYKRKVDISDENVDELNQNNINTELEEQSISPESDDTIE